MLPQFHAPEIVLSGPRRPFSSPTPAWITLRNHGPKTSPLCCIVWLLTGMRHLTSSLAVSCWCVHISGNLTHLIPHLVTRRVPQEYLLASASPGGGHKQQRYGSVSPDTELKVDPFSFKTRAKSCGEKDVKGIRALFLGKDLT